MKFSLFPSLKALLILCLILQSFYTYTFLYKTFNIINDQTYKTVKKQYGHSYRATNSSKYFTLKSVHTIATFKHLIFPRSLPNLGEK